MSCVGFLLVVQWDQQCLGSAGTQVQSLDEQSELSIQHCGGGGLGCKSVSHRTLGLGKKKEKGGKKKKKKKISCVISQGLKAMGT